MKIIKLLGKWLIMLVLVITLILAVLVPALGAFAKVDGPLLTQIVFSSCVIIAACIFLICLLRDYKP